MRAWWLMSVVLAAGCPSATPGAPDAAQGDGGEGAGGLVFTFPAEPPVPATLPGELVVESIELRLADIRAVGDAAPGDARTYEAEHQLVWKDDKDAQSLRFPSAPPGLYSRFQARIAGDGTDDDSYRIEGEVVVDGMEREFEIRDDATLSLSVPLAAVQVIAGSDTTVALTLDVAHLLDTIDWSMVQLDGNTLLLEPGDPQLPGVRARLVEAFGAAQTP